VVAVLDTGVRYDHPDLEAKLHPGMDFIADLATAADGDGRDGDPSDPGDWTTYNECGGGHADVADSSWHGTQVSGLIAAATSNAAGMAGVGRNVMVLPVRVLGKCGGFQSDIVAAMRWAAGLSSDPVVNAHPVRVINMSLGSSGTCSNTYQSAVTELTNAGVAVVVPAGNEAGLAADQPSNCVGAIGVSGLRHAGTKVGYSNIGPEIAIAAPAGNCVNVGATDPCLYPLLTTTNSGATTPVAKDTAYSDSFNATLGTSFSAPLVAGTVALMLSANPSMTVAQVRQTLQATARPFPTSTTDPSSTAVAACHAPNGVEQIECFCTTSTCGAGMLDATAAVARAAGFAPPTALIAVTPSTPVAGTVVSLDGSLSSAASGRSITSYAWAITSGAAIAQFSSATNAPTATVATSGAGTFSVRLTVTDSSGASAATDVTVTVVAPTTAGIAVTPSAPTAGTAVTLDGSPSVAASGRSITSYAWAITSGAAIASLSGPASAPTATVATSGAGNFSVRLTVTDSGGATAAADITVTVAAPDSGGGGSSGGGASSLAWLSALALAAVSLARRPRRR
jgi:serine protease